MTFLNQEKDSCNQTYKQAMNLYENGEYKKSKSLIIEVMEKLLNIYNMYAVSNLEKLFYERKIRNLLQFCKQLNNLINDSNTKNINEILDNESSIKEENIEIVKHCEMDLDSFVGQDRIKRVLKDAIMVSKIKGQAVDHILFYGSAGLGKTTLSRIVANEMRSNFYELNAPTIRNVKNILNIFKTIQNNDIVFIDEIHRLPNEVCESIYTAMQDKKLCFVENGKNNEIDLPNFTLIGATTHSGMMPKPFRDRFYLQLKLDEYESDAINEIIKKCFENENLIVSNETLDLISKKSRGTPRIAIGFAKRIIDKAIIRSVENIDENLVNEFFEENQIDELGLNDLDLKYLNTLVDDFNGGPIGIETLSARLNENRNIIEEQNEPYLINLGFVSVTSKGRLITEKGMEYLNKRGINNEM